MKRYLILSLIAFPLLWSCSNMDYDISEGFSKEVTLFEEEISVPIGNIGPFTISSTLGGVSKVPGIGGLIGEYIKEGEDGSLVMENSGDIFKASVYELEKQIGNVSAPQVWDAGFQSSYAGGMAAALGMFGLKTVNQKVEITASNPLWDDVPVSCGATLSCSGSDYTSVPVPSLDNFTLKARANNELIATQELPASVTAPLTSVSFSKLTLDLPANPVSQISDKKGNLFFAFSFRYICGLAVGETFSLPLKDMSTGDINLPIGKYKVKKCEVSVELESTVPFAVSIDNVRALKPAFAEGEEPAVDDNLVITSGFTIDGGSLEHPATSTIKLEIEALEGTVPDISSLLIDLTVAAQPGLGDVALSGKQGIVVKSSSAKLSGGITIPEEQ